MARSTRSGVCFSYALKAIGLDVLRHRVHLTFEAEAEEVGADDVVKRVFEAVPVP